MNLKDELKGLKKQYQDRRVKMTFKDIEGSLRQSAIKGNIEREFDPTDFAVCKEFADTYGLEASMKNGKAVIKFIFE